MAGGTIISTETGARSDHRSGKVTLYVFFACLVASSGGLLFGYDIGISGGVTSMDSFLKKFFPSVYRKGKVASENETSQYCKFDSEPLTTFTSSLYLAALVASFFASTFTRSHGRRNSMLLGGAVFLAGAVLNGAAENVAMLIVGRILLGIGVGFTTQSIPMYLSEMAPAGLRGMLNIIFQLMITIGILIANIINYLTPKITAGWGWRVNLGGAAIPALIVTIGALFLPDTPNSLIERCRPEEARVVLEKIRGTANMDEEYKSLAVASEEARTVEHPWKSIVQRQYRPHLVMSLAIPTFTQLSGINVIMFYAPVLFKTIGFRSDTALYSAVITGGVNVLATFVSIATVDKVGRRALFLQGGAQMFICQIVVAILIGMKFGLNGVAELSKGYAETVVAFICIYVAGFAWSWGPMGCLVPSEIYPLEIRSAGLSMNVSVSMLFTFVIAQAFLAMLCHLKYFLFFLFAAFVLVMTLFIFFFLPETKNVPIEEMGLVWKQHWFWRRYTARNNILEGKDKKLTA